jgi:hypothetical protein
VLVGFGSSRRKIAGFASIGRCEGFDRFVSDSAGFDTEAGVRTTVSPGCFAG